MIKRPLYWKGIKVIRLSNFKTKLILTVEKTFITAAHAKALLRKYHQEYLTELSKQKPQDPDYGGFPRRVDPCPVICQCNWIGQVKQMIHTYGPALDDDIEQVIKCPQCGEDNFLDMRSSDLYKEIDKRFPCADSTS